jgi:hypothetical protein
MRSPTATEGHTGHTTRTGRKTQRKNGRPIARQIEISAGSTKRNPSTPAKPIGSQTDRQTRQTSHPNEHRIWRSPPATPSAGPSLRQQLDSQCISRTQNADGAPSVKRLLQNGTIFRYRLRKNENSYDPALARMRIDLAPPLRQLQLAILRGNAAGNRLCNSGA